MDWLTFLSDIIESIAWPAAVLALGLLFRKQVSELIPFLRKVKAGPVEAEFEMETKQVLANTEEFSTHFLVDKAACSGKSNEMKEAVARLISARNDPAGVILEAWSEIDGALFRLGNQTGVVVDPLDNMDKVYRSVMSSDLLAGEAKRLVIELYELRNRVAHAKVTPTVGAAQDYVLAADKVVNLIEAHRESMVTEKPSKN